jgi:hypothetical protein
VQLWQAGRREAGDRVLALREREIRLQDSGLANVRVHDQLYSQAEAPAGKVHDEQRARKLHHSTGKHSTKLKINTFEVFFWLSYCKMTRQHLMCKLCTKMHSRSQLNSVL